MERMVREAGISQEEKETFFRWVMTSLADTYKTERMNQRIVVENEINSLGIRLPNGTVRAKYSASFTLPAGKISNVRLEGAEELGLGWEMDAKGILTISGKPRQIGDFTLSLRYETVEGEPASELKIPVAFNPNPRDIWKNKPTDFSRIPYPKPDSASEYVKVEATADGIPRKDMVAASQRGRSHAHEGKPRDDHFSLRFCDGSGWYVMAVADGAGSARFSRKGSEEACETVAEYCLGCLAENHAFEEAIRLWQDDKDNDEKRSAVSRLVVTLLYNGAVKAYEAVKKAAEEKEGATLRDFATTLMFALCKKFDFGWFICSFWVGDGAMGIYDAERKTFKLLGTPDEGEFSGQTRFLTMRDIFSDPDLVKKRMRMTVVPDFTALFLMSDGVSDPMFETVKNLNDYNKWEEFYACLRNGFPEDEIGGVDLSRDNEEAADQLLKWLDFWSQGNHDDRTIAILY